MRQVALDTLLAEVHNSKDWHLIYDPMLLIVGPPTSEWSIYKLTPMC